MVITPVIVIGLINYGNVTRHSEDGDFIHVVLFGGRFQSLFLSSPRNCEKKADCQWLSYCGVGLEHVGTTNQMFQFVTESEMRCCGFAADVCSFACCLPISLKGDMCGQREFSQKVGIDSQITTSRNKSCLKFFVNGNRSKKSPIQFCDGNETPMISYDHATSRALRLASQKGSSGRCFFTSDSAWKSCGKASWNCREHLGSWMYHGQVTWGWSLPIFCAGGVNPCS